MSIFKHRIILSICFTIRFLTINAVNLVINSENDVSITYKIHILRCFTIPNMENARLTYGVYIYIDNDVM